MIKYVIKVKKGETLTSEQIDNIVKLKRIDIERERAVLEHDAEVKKAKAENFKTVAGFAGATATLVSSIFMLDKVNKFEETGTYTTNSGRQMVREFVSKLFKTNK